MAVDLEVRTVVRWDEEELDAGRHGEEPEEVGHGDERDLECELRGY